MYIHIQIRTLWLLSGSGSSAVLIWETVYNATCLGLLGRGVLVCLVVENVSAAIVVEYRRTGKLEKKSTWWKLNSCGIERDPAFGLVFAETFCFL